MAERGESVLYPARVQGTGVVHLARLEARADDNPPAYLAVCPLGDRITAPLEPVPEGAPVTWCPDCQRYRSYLEGGGSTLRPKGFPPRPPVHLPPTLFDGLADDQVDE